MLNSSIFRSGTIVVGTRIRSHRYVVMDLLRLRNAVKLNNWFIPAVILGTSTKVQKDVTAVVVEDIAEVEVHPVVVGMFLPLVRITIQTMKTQSTDVVVVSTGKRFDLKDANHRKYIERRVPG